jgi:hypothetical protein
MSPQGHLTNNVYRSVGVQLCPGCHLNGRTLPEVACGCEAIADNETLRLELGLKVEEKACANLRQPIDGGNGLVFDHHGTMSHRECSNIDLSMHGQKQSRRPVPMVCAIPGRPVGVNRRRGHVNTVLPSSAAVAHSDCVG